MFQPHSLRVPVKSEAAKAKSRAYQRDWQRRNRDKCNEYRRQYQKRIAHLPKKPMSAKVRAYRNRWQRENPERIKVYRDNWLAENGRQWMRDYEKEKRANDPNFRIASTLRCRTRSALRGKAKHETTMSLLGCSMEDFRIYLESRFKQGMTWENYGSFWEIDHIIPCALFDLSKPDHQKRCFHFSNHDPLTVSKNRKKHIKSGGQLCLC
jgi:hypothetical protein